MGNNNSHSREGGFFVDRKKENMRHQTKNENGPGNNERKNRKSVQSEKIRYKNADDVYE